MASISVGFSQVDVSYASLSILFINGTNMSNLSSGRPKKSLLKAAIHFDLALFVDSLAEIGGDATKVSVKGDFESAYIKTRHARASYDYFRKHKNIILQGSQCDDGNPNSVIYPEVATYPSLDDGSVTIPAIHNTPSYVRKYYESDESDIDAKDKNIILNHEAKINPEKSSSREDKKCLIFPNLRSVKNSVFLMNCDDIRVNDDSVTPDTVNKKLYINTKQKERPFLENVISASSCPSENNNTNIYATHTSPDKENLDLPSTPSKPPLAGTGSVVDSPSTIYLEEKSSTFPRQTDAEHFTVAEKCTSYLNPDLWHNLFSKCILRKDGTQKLPTSWTDSISSVMAAAIPSCCINFKRH